MSCGKCCNTKIVAFGGRGVSGKKAGKLQNKGLLPYLRRVLFAPLERERGNDAVRDEDTDTVVIGRL